MADQTRFERLRKLRIILPSDYKDYGGEVVRWEKDDIAYPDCSEGCHYFHSLLAEDGKGEDLDWGFCENPESPRKGLLTFEHQAGFGCFTKTPKL